MGLQISDQKNVDLIAGQLTMEQKSDMNLFNIVGYRLVAFNSKKELRMTIVMRRKIMSEMMTTYFPSLLLMMITFATTFFKPFFFEAALSVNLTTMLMMTTIFLSKMESLPSTANIKMIDIWLVFCQLVPLTEVVLLTAMEYFREDEREQIEFKEEDEGPEIETLLDVHGADVEKDVKGDLEPKQREGWLPVQAGKKVTNPRSKLLFIGKLFLFCVYFLSSHNPTNFHLQKRRCYR